MDKHPRMRTSTSADASTAGYLRTRLTPSSSNGYGTGSARCPPRPDATTGGEGEDIASLWLASALTRHDLASWLTYCARSHSTRPKDKAKEKEKSTETELSDGFSGPLLDSVYRDLVTNPAGSGTRGVWPSLRTLRRLGTLPQTASGAWSLACRPITFDGDPSARRELDSVLAAGRLIEEVDREATWRRREAEEQEREEERDERCREIWERHWAP